jgi:hypothetical protein
LGYDRTYSREEIHQMLWMSERRLRPSTSQRGHPISMHTEQREDPFSRREEVRQDSTFASRKDMVLAVQEALHDAEGQRQLATLNARTRHSCAITVQLTAQLGKIKANVVQNPMARIHGEWMPAQGPQNYITGVLVSSVFVLAEKIEAAESWAPLHIQTAYPKDFLP